ncbi:MAG: metallophosphoesterase family protein [Candidatus Polarisedimenticolia bacterium]
MTPLAIFTGVSAVAALLVPLWAPEPDRAAGLLLVGGVGAELVQSFRRKTAAAQQSAWASAGYTLLLALVLFSSSWFEVTALALFVAGPFLLDGVRRAAAAARLAASGRPFLADAGAAAGNLAAVVVVLLIGKYAPSWIIGVAAGYRLFHVTINLTTTPAWSEEETDQSVIDDIGLDRAERLGETGARLHAAERHRAAADRGWILSLIAVLFAIHVSRMGFDKSALGIVSPLVAVAGDIVVALALAYFVIVPVRLFGRRTTRWLERGAWDRVLAAPARAGVAAWPARVLRWWLESRMRFAIRLRLARYSLPSAFGRGLQIGLPLTAIIVASVPIWGMSWYFDTENWAAGIWNSWAASRTDAWRAAMVRAVVDTGRTTLDGRGFAVTPDGVGGDEPFSFIVIGDTGEGDASQHVLRDSLLRAAAAEDVRFVVLSSDVVYPTGAMKHYESRFWLPFKGVTRPVYAIPGNHDWYDALEGFAATFFEPAAARAAMHARIAEEQGLSSTTDARIEELVEQAALLRRQYGVPTGAQQAPFFQIQTPHFVLLAVDTGVLRGIDDEQMIWLRAALEEARGKLVMAVLGHPFFAGGHDVAGGDEAFTAIRELLRSHGVRAVMAGDTHDLEYYREATMHHWVNGGGGAYLSFGTSLAWPADPATAEWAYYPSQREVIEKIHGQTPWWKWPAWVWTRRFGAWPSSPEWLSAMFDYNVAPFFQSFVVVTVDPAGPRLVITPWGVHGPLTWKDFDRSAPPAPAEADRPAQWVVE